MLLPSFCPELNGDWDPESPFFSQNKTNHLPASDWESFGSRIESYKLHCQLCQHVYPLNLMYFGCSILPCYFLPALIEFSKRELHMWICLIIQTVKMIAQNESGYKDFSICNLSRNINEIRVRHITYIFPPSLWPSVAANLRTFQELQ